MATILTMSHHYQQQQLFDAPYPSPLSEPHASGHSPQPEETRIRRRRRRVAIHIPHELLPHLDKDEIKKWKNRVAAARARQRTQNEVQELQATVEQLHEETQQQHVTIGKLREVIRSLDPRHHAGYSGAWEEPSPEYTPMAMPPPLPMHVHSLQLQHSPPRTPPHMSYPEPCSNYQDLGLETEYSSVPWSHPPPQQPPNLHFY